MRARRFALALLLAAASVLSPRPARAQAPDPRLDWLTLSTPHFRVHFPRGLEELGRRAAANAERAWAQLDAELAPPRGTVDLVVADNVDFAQGYASIFPSSRIVVFAQPPVDDPALRFYDDWSQLVITHELTHVFHLDRVRGGWRALQYVVGRNPALFPNAYGPSWVTEGLAVHYESKLTGAGRLVGTQHRVLARAAALDGRMPRLDELSLASTEFPGGQKSYAYGSLLVDEMARRPGARMRDFVDFTAGQLLPWRLNWAADRTLGIRFKDGYREWRDSVERTVAPAPGTRADSGEAWRQLTRHGWLAEFPRWVDDSTLVYSAMDGRDVRGVYRLTLDGRRERIGRRNSASPNVPLPGGALLFAQQDFVDPYTIRGDLWVQTDTARRVVEFGAAGGSQRRITRGARLAQPDARRDGAVVAVQSVAGTTRLVRVSVEGRVITPLTAAHPDTQWTEPRWSPDGARIVAIRIERGGVSSVVVLDSAGAEVETLIRERAVASAPAWMPDGRTVVFSSDRSGRPRVLARALGGAATATVNALANGTAPAGPDDPAGVYEPVPSPVTGRLAAVVLRGDGEHVVAITGERTVADDTLRYAQRSTVPPVARDSSPARAYSPWRTLAPRYWTPVVTPGDASTTLFGAATSGSDVIGRHAYAVQALVNGSTGDFDGFLAWRYARFGQPLVDVSGSQTWDYSQVAVQLSDGSTLVVPLDRRERSAAVALTFQRPRVRTSSSLSVGASYEHRSYRSTLASLPPAAGEQLGTDFPAVFVAGGWTNARRALRSVSAEDGVGVSGSAEQRWGAPGGGTRTAIGALRAYKSLALPGFARHALAVRVAGGAADERATTELTAGGVSGAAAELLPGVVLGTPARTFGVRGFPAGVQRGTRAAAASVEYRAPLTAPSRGLALLPAFLDRVSVAAFGDAGSAWCPPRSDGSPPPICRILGDLAPAEASWLASAGAELDLDAALQYDAPIRFRLGVAVPLRNRQLADGDVVGYVTLGVSF